MRIGCIHEVYTSQIFIARHDIQRVLARNVHEIRQSRTRTNKDSLETFGFQFGYTDSFTYDNICLEVYTHLAKIVNLCLYDTVGQTEFGYTIFQHTANLMQSFEHINVKTILCHVTGKAKS